MENKRKVFIMNLALVIMLVICILISSLMLILMKSRREIAGKSGNQKYATTEETTETNSWDISANEDGTVIANLSSDGILTISGTGKMKDWTTNVTPWSYPSKEVKSVKIEEGVTNIGKFAFSCCYNLNEIEIANSVSKIASHAFYGSDNIKSIQIPSGVINIHCASFSNCGSLMQIKVDTQNTVYCDDNGVLFSKDKTNLLRYPEGKTEKEYKIPDGVINIGQEAFFYAESLTKIEIPNTVKTIGQDAFREI